MRPLPPREGAVAATGGGAKAAAFRPFEDGSTLTIGELAIESGDGTMAIQGALALSCDKESLGKLEALRAAIDDAISHLRAQDEMPDHAEITVQEVSMADNPLR